MKTGERIRVRVAFGLLGIVPVFLTGWLGWVQVAQAGELRREGGAPLRLVPATADRQAWREERVPTPRGTIVDRDGSLLAIDRETYDVRATLAVPASEGKRVEALRAWIDAVANDFARALVADPGFSSRGDMLRERQAEFRKLLHGALRTAELPAQGEVPAAHPRFTDVRIAGGVDSLAVIEALRAVGAARSSVTMHFLRTFRRDYPEREATAGLVGHVKTDWVSDPATQVQRLETWGVCGLEALAALTPADADARPFLRDGRGNAYFVGPLQPLPVPNVLHSTIDIELQREADRLLGEEAEAVSHNGESTRPAWGALVLVEMATGDVLAATSWLRDRKSKVGQAFAPYQSLYEPGSIVKPLVLAYALEAGRLDWNHEFDCAPGSADYRERIGSLGSRVVRDDHACGVLSAHGILVNSSNIGATYVGLQLEREQWQDYMRFFGFGRSLGLALPHEALGGPNKRSFDGDIPLRSFRRNSAISFSFGYEMQVNALQMARAYLRLYRGGDAELRLCRGVEIGGQWHAAPPARSGGARLRPEVVDAVHAALVDVVSDDPHATGTHLHRRFLTDTGVDLHGVVAGKTGTAASRIGIRGRGRVEVRNASFVGVLPAEAPRWLVVCVLQKDDDARFYGGSYAAPPAVRLLLRCQELEQRRPRHEEPQRSTNGQVRAAQGSPGVSGWGY
ncbi:MAG: hypothetical protein JNL08_06505 [Planctomycetes bacterium]|nr:hypothetical protein [Planctomycetota bacterium]